MPPLPIIIATRRLPAPVESELVLRYGARLNRDDHPFTPDELIAAMQEGDVVLCTVSDQMTAAVLQSTPFRARLLANFGAGVDNIALDAARDAGLVVTNTPGVLTEDTADLTMLLLLAVARRFRDGERDLRAGRWTGWRPTYLLGTRVSGRTIGIVGLGRIGRAVALRAHRGFGMRVLYHTRHDAPDNLVRELGAERCTLDDLLARSDFVSLHCPANPDTHHLIDASRLRQMRSTAFLINTSRGDVVDESALVAALRNGTIAGAALDVFEREPAVDPALLALDNVVALPHLGSATTESRTAMGHRALANIAAFLGGSEPPDRVV
jgi:lactate dehydrogenase-like 2-hydroxyacid dehydrogenase